MKKYYFLSFFIFIFFAFSQAHAAPAQWWRITTFQSEVDKLDATAVEHLKMPVLIDVKPGDFVDTFGKVYTSGSVHQGEDIFARRGAYVVSPTDAVVMRIDTTGAGGNAVYTANPGNETFYYAHLNGFAKDLNVGDVLKPGDLIGYVGNSGDAEGASTHLHFQIFALDGPVNPYARLDTTFSTQERMDVVTTLLNAESDKAQFAHDIVSVYRSSFEQAQHESVTLPSEIQSALGQSSTSSIESTPTTPATPSSSTISGNLSAGMRNDDVKVMQAYLIDKKVGQYAATLASYGATGYFGTLTKTALIEFQRSVGISASGFCGPITRAYIVSHL